MTLADLLRDVLDDRCLSPLDLAVKARLPHTAVYSYINGKAAPSLAALQKIARALDVSLNAFADVEVPRDARRREYSASA